MKFIVAKCPSMRVTRHYSHKQIIHDYTLHQQTLENVQSAKYFDITITENMDWGQHISDISPKATKTLGFLLRPIFKTQIQQVEKVQRVAARWTCSIALVVLARCSMSYNGQLWRPEGINSLRFSSTKIIVSIDKDKYLTPSQRTRSNRGITQLIVLQAPDLK